MTLNRAYNPGCALMLYKPDYAEKVLQFLNQELGGVEPHTICCRHAPGLPSATQIINTCAGCDKRFSALYEGITTLSLWEILAKSDTFPFPDHSGLIVTVHDACPVRGKSQVHEAIRTVLRKMNIEVIEAANNRTRSACCGDDLYPEAPLDTIHAFMKKRADSMPCEDVCVYCVSCIKSMHIGGKKPRYILDLLFDQPTDPQVYDTIQWHAALQEYINAH